MADELPPVDLGVIDVRPVRLSVDVDYCATSDVEACGTRWTVGA